MNTDKYTKTQDEKQIDEEKIKWIEIIIMIIMIIDVRDWGPGCMVCAWLMHKKNTSKDSDGRDNNDNSNNNNNNNNNNDNNSNDNSNN